MEFATFCNICFHKANLRKIEETEHLLNILMIFIDNKILLNRQEIYLCLKCCEKLESYDHFKRMCLRNFRDFRLEYSELQKKLETMNDSNIEEKLRNFIKTKIDQASETLTVDGSKDAIQAENNVLSLQTSENELITKQYVLNNSNYDFDSVKCKTEKIDYEDNEEYKFHTEVGLDNSGNDLELPVPIEHIKVESYVEEDILQTEYSSKTKLGEPSKSSEAYKGVEACHSSTELIQHEELTSGSVPNKNSQSSNEVIRKIECKVCGKSFANVGNLKIHMGIHTKEEQYSHVQYSQELYNKTHSKQRKLKVQESTLGGEKRHVCDICNKTFSKSKLLRAHILTHSDKKPYTCLTCNKSFRRMTNLNNHNRVHTGEKPYACDMCEKTFSNSGNLRAHKFIHTQEKPYSCEVCGKSFSHINSMKAHERIHRGEKPYECVLCHERFTQLHAYKVHKLGHTGEKPHSCNVCKKAFRQLSTLREHERIHTGVKPYICEICKNAFRRRSQFRLHKIKCVPQVVQDQETDKSEET